MNIFLKTVQVIKNIKSRDYLQKLAKSMSNMTTKMSITPQVEAIVGRGQTIYSSGDDKYLTSLDSRFLI